MRARRGSTFPAGRSSDSTGAVHRWRHLVALLPAAGGGSVRNESFGCDDLNRLTHSYVAGRAVQAFAFAANGNIQSKSGIGSYAYGERGHGPHAVTSITVGAETKRSYSYDAKGRMTDEYVGTDMQGLPLRSIQYTSFDQPRSITHRAARALSSDLDALGTEQTPWDRLCTIDFYFGPGLQRLIQVKTKGLLTTRVLYLGGYEVHETRRGPDLTSPLVEKEERSSFGNGVRVKRYTATDPLVPVTTFEFGVRDHLGSDSATYDGAGELQQQRGHLKDGEAQRSERQSYDAWGARRDGDTWAGAAGQLGPPGGSWPSEPAADAEQAGSNVSRGFTRHEMLDDVGLVHMNGRLYDPALGRMCAADPDVQAPEFIQNYNRYSYVLNNPLNAIDPTGNNWLKKVLYVVVAVVIAVVVVVVAVYALGTLLSQAGGYLASAGSWLVPTSAAITAGAKTAAGINAAVFWATAAGAAWSAGNTALRGGTFSQTLRAAAIGAASGAVGAMVGGMMHGLGEAWGSYLAGGTSELATVAHLAAHGVAGGGMSEAMGGTFRDGFIGGVVGAGLGGIGSKVFGPGFAASKAPGAIAGRTAIAAVSGGLAAVATGGKFGHAAFSAAFFHLFNHELDNYIFDARMKSARDAPWELDISGNSKGGPSTIVLYDGADDDLATRFASTAPAYGLAIDISIPGWGWAYMDAVGFYGGSVDRVIILDHGARGTVQFGPKGSVLSNKTLKFIGAAVRQKIVFFGCQTGASLGKNDIYSVRIREMSIQIPGVTLVGYTRNVYAYGKLGAGTYEHPGEAFGQHARLGSEWSINSTRR